MNDAFICDAVRTPIGRYGGALSQVRTDDLAALPIAALMERNPDVDWASVDDTGLVTARGNGPVGLTVDLDPGADAGGDGGQAGGQRLGDRAVDQPGVGPAEPELAGDGDAHPAARAVGDDPDRVERFLGAAGGDQGPDAGQVGRGLAAQVAVDAEDPSRYDEPIFLEASIGCERCHGPGRAEVGLKLYEAFEAMVMPLYGRIAAGRPLLAQRRQQGRHVRALRLQLLDLLPQAALEAREQLPALGRVQRGGPQHPGAEHLGAQAYRRLICQARQEG